MVYYKTDDSNESQKLEYSHANQDWTTSYLTDEYFGDGIIFSGQIFVNLFRLTAWENIRRLANVYRCSVIGTIGCLIVN